MVKKIILHIMTRYLGGGSETYVNQLIDGLDKEKYEHIIMHGKSYNPDILRKDIKMICLKNLSHYNPVTNLLAVRDIYKYLKNNDIDIVHTHQTEAGIVGRIAANLYKKKFLDDKLTVIHTVHGIPFVNNRNYILRKSLIYLEKEVAPYTDHIITISKNMKQIYLDNKIGIPGQFKYIPLGIDLDLFEKVEPAKDIINDSKNLNDSNIIRFVIVARITKGKGFEDLIKAVSILVNTNKEKLKVYIVGKGEDKKYVKNLFKQINELGLYDNFIFLGHRKDVPDILKACDVFVLPSYFEGTPWTIYEAMAAGLPVISTNIGGIPEQIEHNYNGFLFNPGEIVKLASYMTVFIKNKSTLIRLSNNSKKKIREFTLDKMIKKVGVLYDDNK